jgi:hypothetical protein
MKVWILKFGKYQFKNVSLGDCQTTKGNGSTIFVLITRESAISLSAAEPKISVIDSAIRIVHLFSSKA